MGRWRFTGIGRSEGGSGSPRRTSLVVLTLFLLLAGACGGDDSASEASAAAPDATYAAPATTAAAMPEAEEATVALETALAEMEATAATAAGDAEATAAMAMAEAEAAEEMAASDDEMEMEEAFDDMVDSDDAGVDRSTAGAVLEVSTTYTPSAFGRDVIYRAWVSVEAPDVAAATREGIAIVQGLGGFVFGQQTRTQPQPYSEIVFKVLPEDFSVALSRLSQIGELIDQQISADDVTERIVDLQSQVITSEASVARLRSFLETATNIDNVAFYERELLVRETDLERLRGQLRTLQDHVSLATITLAISQLPDP